MQNYFLYILIFIFLDSKFNDKSSTSKAARIPWIKSALHFFLNRILIRWIYSQIHDLSHPLKTSFFGLCIVTSSCILFSKHDNLFSFISVYFQSISLLANIKTPAIFFIACTLPPNILIS